MTWNKQNDLICDWCGKIVIPSKEVTDGDKKFNTGQTKCSACIDNEIPYPSSGNIEDLPNDFFGPNIRNMQEYLETFCK